MVMYMDIIHNVLLFPGQIQRMGGWGYVGEGGGGGGQDMRWWTRVCITVHKCHSDMRDCEMPERRLIDCDNIVQCGEHSRI